MFLAQVYNLSGSDERTLYLIPFSQLLRFESDISIIWEECFTSITISLDFKTKYFDYNWSTLQIDVSYFFFFEKKIDDSCFCIIYILLYVMIDKYYFFKSTDIGSQIYMFYSGYSGLVWWKRFVCLK